MILSFPRYRENHLLHHRNLNTDRDPDWVFKQNDEWRFPMSRADLLKLFLKDLLGFGLVVTITRASRLPRPSGRPARDARMMLIARVFVTMTALAAILWLGLGIAVLLYWVVPFATWLQLCLRIRSIAEHYALDPSRGNVQTRTVSLSFIDRVFVLSNATSFHGEHHFYPGVPFYQLRALHHELVDRADYTRSVEVTEGYWGVVKACCRPRDESDLAARSSV